MLHLPLIENNYDELMLILSAVRKRVCQGHSSIVSECDRLREPVLNVLERGIISDQEFKNWIADISTYEKTGDAKEDIRHIMSRCEFMIFLRGKIKEKHPHLFNIVWDAVVKLMEL